MPLMELCFSGTGACAIFLAMAGNLTDPSPQFTTAEYAATPGSERCKPCNQTLGSQYYRVNGALTCAYCAEQTKLRLPQDNHPTFVRGLVFGIGGAILGLALYSAFGVITGLVIGYISLAVGYIVGKAMMKGSNGIGGRRYQIAAVVLTYAAVSMAAIPIGISQIVKQKKEHKQASARHAAPASAQSDHTSQAATAEEGVEPDQAPVSGQPKMSLGAALGMLAIAGLASPFLALQDPVHGVIGLIILLVGIRIAWRITAGVKVDILGPFKTTSQPANAPASS
jgi:hypothetical protein